MQWLPDLHTPAYTGADCKLPLFVHHPIGTGLKKNRKNSPKGEYTPQSANSSFSCFLIVHISFQFLVCSSSLLLRQEHKIYPQQILSLCYLLLNSAVTVCVVTMSWSFKTESLQWQLPISWPAPPGPGNHYTFCCYNTHRFRNWCNRCQQDSCLPSVHCTPMHWCLWMTHVPHCAWRGLSTACRGQSFDVYCLG